MERCLSPTASPILFLILHVYLPAPSQLRIITVFHTMEVVRPSLASVYGTRPDHSDRSMKSDFSLSLSIGDMLSLDLGSFRSIASTDLLLGSFRSIASTDLLPPHEVDNDRERDDERQCNDASVAETELEPLTPFMTSRYDDCPIETTQLYPTAVSFDEYPMPTHRAENSSSTPTEQESEVTITLMNENIQDVSMEPVDAHSSPASSSARGSLSAYTVEPRNNDILFGRGPIINRHPGNVRFRQVVLELRQVYGEMTKTEKYDFSKVLLERMKNENRRFLKKSLLDRLWYEVDDERARVKVSQALREGNTA
jgi:hypothetical protein